MEKLRSDMKKRYMMPQACSLEVLPAQIVAYSVHGKTAEPESPVLVKDNEWDIFGEAEDVNLDSTE